MSFKSLTLDQYYQLKQRKEDLERIIDSYTCYAWFDPPLKTPEEIESLKKLWRAELTSLSKILAKYEDAKIGQYLIAIHEE